MGDWEGVRGGVQGEQNIKCSVINTSDKNGATAPTNSLFLDYGLGLNC